MLKVAVVGAGFMGTMHRNVYAQLKDVQVVAVVDGEEEKARKIASGAKVYTCMDDMLDKEKPDLVDICLPTYLHAEHVVKAAEAGAHVLCEKPMAMNLEEADRMIEAAERAGVFFMVAHCIRFWPEYVAFKEILDGGSLGGLRSLSLVRLSPTPTWSWEDWLMWASRSGSAALDLHIHDTDYVLYLFGTPKAVWSKGTWVGDGCVHIFTLYDYGDGPAVSAEGGWDMPPSYPFHMDFRATFDKGAVQMSSARQPTMTVYPAEGEPYPPALPKPDLRGVEAGGNISEMGGYFNEIKYFVECILEGRKPEVVTPRDARESLRVVLAEMESARKGEPVEL